MEYIPGWCWPLWAAGALVPIAVMVIHGWWVKFQIKKHIRNLNKK